MFSINGAESWCMSFCLLAFCRYRIFDLDLRERLGMPRDWLRGGMDYCSLLPALDVVVFRPDELVHDRLFLSRA